MAKTRSAGLLLALALAAPALRAAPAHDKAFWREIAKNRYAVPGGERAFPLARELGAALASPDPELRDDLAYSILAAWISDARQFSREELAALAREWTANLRAGLGERDEDSVFRRSFSALCLASLAERDLRTPFLGDDGYRTLVEAAFEYLAGEQDLRGFDPVKGWVHATAHTADLLAALARNRLFTREDQARLLARVAERLASAPVFTYGEQDRLAHAVAALAARQDFERERFAAWLAELDETDQRVWRDSPPRAALLWRFENDSYFLRALVVELTRSDRPAAREAEQQALRALARR